MNPESQRIAIAEACGWTFEPSEACPEGIWHDKYGAPTLKDFPDYLTDLNAMHEAEKVIMRLADGEQQPDHWDIYCSFLGYGSDRIRATAETRAKAFLRTLNLWTDQKGTM